MTMQRGILGLILLVLGLTAAPLYGAASAAPAVQAEQDGRQVRVTGVAPPNSEVALIVLSSATVPVHADQTAADADGAFRFAWTPGGWSAGTYEVRVTGDRLESPLTVRLAYVPEDGQGGDSGGDSGGDGSDGNNDGGSGGDSGDADGQPGGGQGQPAEPSGTGMAEVEPTERGARIRLGGNESGERLPDGLWTSAVHMLTSRTADSADARLNREIAIELPDGTNGEGGIELPAAELLAAVTEELADRTTLVVRLGQVEYALPLDVLLDAAEAWSEKAARQGGSSAADGLRLRIDIRKAGAGTFPGLGDMRLLGEAYRFEIRSIGLPSDMEWKRFTDRFATRKLPLQRLPASGYAAGYYWEEGMTEPAFVPLRLEQQDGVNYAVLTRAGNSVYYAAESAAPALSDIAGHWAEPTLRRLAAQRLVHGMPDGTFRPDAPVTRAQFAALLARATALAHAPTAAAGPGFADVRSGDWHAGAVQAVASQGWMAGFGDGRFGPDGMLTRQEAAAALHRIWTQANVAHTPAGAPNFADRSGIAPWAADAVSALAEIGILQGTPDGRFQPERALTRAEAASLLSRLLEALGWTHGQA